MKKYIISILVCLTFFQTKSIEVIKIPIVKQIEIEEEPLIKALMKVESNNDSLAVGDTHLTEFSIGILQIRPIMVDECNRILKLLKKDRPKFKYSDRISKRKSIEMFKLWRDYHHKGSSEEVVARNWNGGTYGYKNSKTKKYWKKVLYELQRSI